MSTVNIPVYERQFAVVLPEELRACYFKGEVPASMRQQFDEWKELAFVDGVPPPSMTESNVAKFFLRTVALTEMDALGAVPLSTLFPMSSASITALDAQAVRRAAVSGHAQLTRAIVDMAIHPADVTPIAAKEMQKVAASLLQTNPPQAEEVNIDRNLLDFFLMRGNAKYRKDLMINVSLEEAHGAKGLAERVERRMGVLGEFERELVRRLLAGESPTEVMKDARHSRSVPSA
ncbi:hypothetical protein [Chromobacterium vaccinii]|uniref:hypothetical protein n=1 Tax=Chromobacterium vaccinii TaxID=1108595 RepID=UPI000E14F81E|nr:hypothetical protein [Chromobacterium vaccinii]SUX55932.1 Uncharacterised protein [Chromobacterium vaccinii]